MKKLISIILVLFLCQIGSTSADDVVDFDHHMQKLSHKLPLYLLENSNSYASLSDINIRLKLVEKYCNKKNKVLWTEIIELPIANQGMLFAEYEDDPFLPEHFLSLFKTDGLGCVDTFIGNYTTDGRTKMLNFFHKNEYKKVGNVYTKFKGCLADEQFPLSNILIFDTTGIYNQNFVLTDEFFAVSGTEKNNPVLNIFERNSDPKIYTDSQLIVDLSLHDTSRGTFLDVMFFNDGSQNEGKNLVNLKEYSTVEKVREYMGEEWFEHLHFPNFQSLSIATYFNKNRISRVLRFVFVKESIAKQAHRTLQKRLKFKLLSGIRDQRSTTLEELLFLRGAVDFRIVKFRNKFVLEINITENEDLFSKTGSTKDCFNPDRPIIGPSMILRDIIVTGDLHNSYEY